MPAPDAVSRLARRISALERQGRARSTPQLSHSSIEDGALQEFDADGNLASVIGQQWDGTHGAVAVTGPIPPTPSIPTLSAVVEGFIVRWDGLFVDPTDVAPMDFEAVDVMVGTEATFNPLTASPSGSFTSARGGYLSIAATDGEPRWVALVTRTAAGKRSAPSAVETVNPIAFLAAIPPDDDAPVSFTTDPLSIEPRVEIDPIRGFRYILPDGTVTVQFDSETTAATFTDLVAKSVSTLMGAALRGSTEIPRDATVTLGTSTTAPASPLRVSVDYDTVQHAESGWENRRGLTIGHDGKWYTANSATNRIEAWNEDGTLAGSWPLNPDSRPYGIVYAANVNRYFVLAKRNAASGYWCADAYSPTFGTRLSITVLIDNTYMPTLGWDRDNNRLLLGIPTGSWFDVYTYSVTVSGAANYQNSYFIDGIGAVNYDVNFVAMGAFDFGATRIIFRRPTATDTPFQVFTTGNVQQSAQQWLPNGNTVKGGWWDGTHFHSMNPFGVRTRYEPPSASVTGLSEQWAAAATYRDTDAAGAGLHETNRGTLTSFTMKRRAKLSLEFPATIPDYGEVDDPDSIGWYLGKGAAPARTALWRQTQTGPGVTHLDVTEPVFTGTNPPAANDFTMSQNPGALQATSGGLIIRGDSSGSPGTGGFLEETRRLLLHPEWACQVTRNSNQSVPHLQDQLIDYPLTVHDASNMHDPNVAPATVTIPAGATGIYRILLTVTWAGSTVGRRQIHVNRNAAGAAGGPTTGILASSKVWNADGETTQTIMIEERLFAGDILRSWAWQNSGAALNLIPIGGMPAFSVRWVSP